MDKSLLDQLDEKRRKGRAMGGPDKVKAQAAKGKLNARERLDVLLDPGSFVEVGVLNRAQTPELYERTPADGLVAGSGRIDGRQVYVTSEDSTVQAGTRGQVAEKKSQRIRQLAASHRLPYIALTEAGAGRFQEMSGALAADVGYRFGEHFDMSGKVPQCTAFLGASFGGPTFAGMQSDFVAIVRDSGYMGLSGPPLVRVGLGQEVTKEEIGGAEMSARETGQADYLADNEREALLSIREFLSYFPANAWEMPPRRAPEPAAVDTPEGRAAICNVVSEEGRKAYNGLDILRLIVDGGKFFQYRALFGRSLICAWARMQGETVGFMVSNPLVLGGVMDDKAAIKARNFVELCDAFHIPFVSFIDCPGFMVGPKIEMKRMASLVGRLLNAMIGATVPKVTIVVRKAIGLAYLALGGKPMRPDLIVGWPTCHFDPMGPTAGIELVHGRAIASAPDPAALRAELLAQATLDACGYRAAEMGLIDDIIHPAETRNAICSLLERARPLRQPGFKHRIDP